MSLKENAKAILGVIQNGFYEIDGIKMSVQSEYEYSLAQSRLYHPDELERLRAEYKIDAPSSVEVVDGTTQQVALELAGTGSVTLLNFASARNPGGGFLNGAKAQEEDLCRCSALFPTLEKHIEYYEVNRREESLLYTDYLIHSPLVPFFKVRGTGEFLEEPFLASVVTAPAPNTGPYLRRSGSPELLEECFARRWQNVLVAAADQKAEYLLLGAWGCGAFGGDPHQASRTAKVAIDGIGGFFRKIVFAIPGKGKQSQRNLEVFREQLS